MSSLSVKPKILERVRTPLKSLTDLFLHAPDMPRTEYQMRRFGYLVCVALVIGGGLWASFAPIESAALAPGVIQVDGNRKPVQHLEGGIVKRVLVKDGDFVDANTPLIVLDSARDQADLNIVEMRRLNMIASVERLMAERDDQDQLLYSESLLATGVNDPRAVEAMRNEKSLFIARQADRRGELAVLETRRAQFDQQVAGLSKLIDAQRQVLESLVEEIDDLRTLLDAGYVDKQRLRELQRSQMQLIGEISDLDAKAAAGKVAVREAQLQIAQLGKRFKTTVVDELTSNQEALHDIEQEHSAIVDRVERATVRAPVAGRVMNLKPNSNGAVIGSGSRIAEIVPQQQEFIVEARVSPMDIDRVRVGQEAEVRLAVFKDAYTVTGTLTRLSADRVIDEATDFPYYKAEVRLSEDDIELMDGVALVPGMPATVLIKTGERTMLGYIVSPMNRVFSKSLIED